MYNLEDGRECETALNEVCGAGVELAESTVGAVVVRHHFWARNPMEFVGSRGRVEKALRMVGGGRARIVESGVGHFAVEVVRAERGGVSWAEVVGGGEAKSGLLLGVDQEGEAVRVGLSEMPHLLIAGATGSGKSVCLNGLIMQLLTGAEWQAARLVLIDTKKVELGIYKERVGVFADSVRAALDALFDVVKEMRGRYDEMAEKGLREYDGGEIVVVVDELADLMLSGAKAIVERHLVTLAQMGRAAKVHLILATQRPQVKVCTGLILANVPTRICLQTAAVRDSVLCLGHKGAEELLGKGDALVKLATEGGEKRVQVPFISVEEIAAKLGK